MANPVFNQGLQQQYLVTDEQTDDQTSDDQSETSGTGRDDQPEPQSGTGPTAPPPIVNPHILAILAQLQKVGSTAPKDSSGASARSGAAPPEGKSDDGAMLETAKTVLDVAGFIPVIGTAANLASAGISLAQGKYGEAALSAAAAIPVVGMLGEAAKGAKLVGKGVRAGEELVEGGTKAATKVGAEATAAGKQTVASAVQGAGGAASSAAKATQATSDANRFANAAKLGNPAAASRAETAASGVVSSGPAEEVAAASVLRASRTGMSTGVTLFDQLFSKSPEAKQMISALERRGVDVVDDVSKLMPGEAARTQRINGKLTVVYDSKSSSYLDMLHECRHVAQVQRAESTGALGAKDIFKSQRMIRRAERGAYEYESRLGKKRGFSDEYMSYLRKQIRDNHPPGDVTKFEKSDTTQKIFRAIEPGLGP